MNGESGIRWTQIVERINMPGEVIDRLLACDREWDHSALAADIEALADPMRAEEMFRVLSEKVAPDEDNIRILLCELLAAEHMWLSYCAAGIPEEIFYDTMGIFSRVLCEAKVYSGRYAVDRVWWIWRQSGMVIFRLGALEFEFKRSEHIVHIHIPSDADFSPAAVEDSLGREREFCRRFLPSMADASIYCDSWLMSDVLRELLPSDSNIVRFQDRFTMLSQEHESRACIRWLFKMLPDTPDEQLREDTTLQRRVKQLLLSGRNVGAGKGILKV